MSRGGGQSLEPAVGQDTRVAGHFDENVGKTKPETEGSVSFILAGDNRTRRVDVVEARVAERWMRPETNKTPKAIVSLAASFARPGRPTGLPVQANSGIATAQRGPARSLLITAASNTAPCRAVSVETADHHIVFADLREVTRDL